MKLRALLLSVFSISLFVLLGSLNIAAAAGPAGDATQTVRQVNTNIAKTLSKAGSSKAGPKAGPKADSKPLSKQAETKLLAQARTQLGDFLDIEELGKRAMKDHWPTLTPQQRTEFLSLLRDLIETNYLQGLRSNLSYKVNYLGEKAQGQHVRVQTVVLSERKGRPLKIEIDYLLSKSGKDWRTFDISTDGIGLVENYRSMFNSIIAKSGTEELLERMRAKLATLTK